MIKKPTLYVAVTFALILPFFTLTPVTAISSEQSAAVSQNCPSIKQSLTQLQRSDSRARTYLGTIYENLINKFITPLNLRLVKNNLAPFSDLQTSFINQQTKFKNSYTEYMKELETLIATDCQNHPDDFYRRLTDVRAKRKTLHDATARLSDLASQQYQTVQDLRGTL